MLDSFQTQKASLTKTLNPFIASKHIHILVIHLNIWRVNEASDTISGVTNSSWHGIGGWSDLPHALMQ